MPQPEIRKQILTLALPLIAANLLQQLYNMIDAIFIGQCAGPVSLAAVGIGSQVILFTVYLFIGLSMGAGVAAAQAYGAREHHKMFNIVHTVIGLSLISGLLLTVLGLYGSRPLLDKMNVPPEVMPLAERYLWLYFLSMIPLLLHTMGNSLLRAVGDAKTGLYSLLISGVFKVALNFLFVGAWGWGVTGAALTTVLAQTMAAGLVLWRLARRPPPCCLKPAQIRLNPAVLRMVLAIGLPTGFQLTAQCFANLYFQAKLNLHGVEVMAASVAFNRLDWLLYMPIEGFALALSVLVGQNFGAGHLGRIGRMFRAASVMSVALTLTSSVILIAAAPALMKLFIPNDPTALDYSVLMVIHIVPLYFIYGLNQNFAGMIRGVGQARGPMIIGLVFTSGLRIAWSAAFSDNLIILFYSYPVSWLATWLVYHIYCRKSGWLKKPKPIRIEEREDHA